MSACELMSMKTHRLTGFGEESEIIQGFEPTEIA